MANKTNTTAPSTTARGQRAPKGVLRRLLRTLFEFYPVLLPVTMVCIVINAVVSAAPSIFMQNVIQLVDDTYKSGDWDSVSGRIFTLDRRCVLHPDDGHHHPGVAEKAAREDVQPHAGSSHPIL